MKNRLIRKSAPSRIHPKSVHIEEVSLYLLNLENTIYEMQILIDK